MRRDPSFTAQCRSLTRAIAKYSTLEELRSSSEWPALEPCLRAVLGTVRRYQPPQPPRPSPNPDRIKAVHWNVEHGNRYEQIEAALAGHPELAEADVHLFNEIDLGMARAGNRDVTGDLTAALHRYAVWAPLFLETTVGRHDDAKTAANGDNQESLFGIAILSRWPITGVQVVELPSPERLQFDRERMYGRHVGLIATIDRPAAPFLVVSVHLEVHRTRRDRAAQVNALLAALRDESLPVVLAGDFNTHTFDRGRARGMFDGARALVLTRSRSLRKRLLFPDRGEWREPLFDGLRDAGFEWDRFVDRAPTLQLRFERLEEMRALPRLATAPLVRVLTWAERRAALRLDWFAGRGWGGGTGYTVRGLDGPGNASDHAPIVAEFWK